MYNVNKYSVSSFNQILSIDSKFDTINKFYKDLLKLNDVKSQNKIAKQKNNFVKKMHHCFTISGLICTRKSMSRFLKTKMKTGGKNMIIKRF